MIEPQKMFALKLFVDYFLAKTFADIGNDKKQNLCSDGRLY